jgi:hypothetical protein
VPSPDKAETLRERRRDESTYARRLVLEEVRTAFNRRRQSPWSFEAWLNEEIKKATAGDAVKRSA